MERCEPFPIKLIRNTSVCVDVTSGRVGAKAPEIGGSYFDPFSSGTLVYTDVRSSMRLWMASLSPTTQM